MSRESTSDRVADGADVDEAGIPATTEAYDDRRPARPGPAVREIADGPDKPEEDRTGGLVLTLLLLLMLLLMMSGLPLGK